MKPTIINQNDYASLHGVVGLARDTRDLLSTNAARGASARPTVAQLNATLERLTTMADLVEHVLERMFVAAPIVNASVTETIIVGKLVKDLLAAGFQVSIDDGGGLDESPLQRSTDAATIYAALASTDSDRLYLYRKDARNFTGWVYLVWGNDVDVVSDYTSNIQKHVAGANQLAEDLDNG